MESQSPQHDQGAVCEMSQKGAEDVRGVPGVQAETAMETPSITQIDDDIAKAQAGEGTLLDDNGAPLKNYPLPAHPSDRRAEFENVVMRAYMEGRALETGEEPPERRYQSDFDRKWHEWVDRQWERYQNLRVWAEEKAPRTLRFFDKAHDVAYWIGDKTVNALGINQSRYQWVIDAAEWHAYLEEKERREEEEALAEMQAEEDRAAAAEVA